MVSYGETSKEELIKKAELLKVLGHPERLAIALLTLYREMCVKELVEALQISQPKVSQHVGLMKEVGLLTFRKEGTKVLYRVKGGAIREVVELLFNGEK